MGNSKSICHFTSKNNDVRLTDGEGFLENRIGELYRYHPIIPFKYSRRIAEQIAWAYSNDFRKGQYNLINRNCEHFANMTVYGINYSEQIENSSLAGFSDGVSGFNFGTMNVVANVLTFGNVSVRAEGRNNGKGSTIKLTNEMSESNGILGEESNWLSNKIKANIEVPFKDNCRIM